MNTRSFYPTQTTDAVVRVTHYEDGKITCWLSHARMEAPMKLRSMPQLLLTLDEIFSQEDLPVEYHASIGEVSPEKAIATLRIRILFREHHSWQGSVIWEEQQLEAPFLSVLELIEILDEILSE